MKEDCRKVSWIILMIFVDNRGSDEAEIAEILERKIIQLQGSM